MRLRVVLATVLLVGLATGCGSDPDIVGAGTPVTTLVAVAPDGPDLTEVTFEDRTGQDATEVQAVDNTFRAKYIEVRAGTTITFDNRGRTAHDVLPVTEGAFATILPADLEPTAQASITLDAPGDYAYYCSLHGTTTKGMTGAIRVVE